MKNKEIELKIEGSKMHGVIENCEADKIIILVHGFTGNMNGNKDIYKKLSNELQCQGYAVLRFNFRGTPPSEGEFENMTVEQQTQDLKEIIKYTKSLGYNEIGLIGESMGGTIALEAYEESIKILVLWYSAFNFGDTSFKEFLSQETKKVVQENGYIDCYGFKIGKNFLDQIPAIDVYQNLENISCPTLVLHGDKDSDVPYQQSEKAFEILKCEKEIHIIKGTGHCFPNAQEKAISLTSNFIKKHF